MNLWYHCYEILAAPTLSVALYKTKKRGPGWLASVLLPLATRAAKKRKRWFRGRSDANLDDVTTLRHCRSHSQVFMRIAKAVKWH